MESLAPRQPSQKRSQPTEQTSNSQPASHTPSSPARARSEDSQTVFLNKTDPEEADYTQDQQSSPQTHTPQQPDPDTDSSIKKCWICFSDSTEDTPETSPWRDPCPCALVAHEECLLDWIADMEAPNNRRSQRGVAAPKIECPQCKSEIKLSRPRNLVVEAVRGIERLGSQLITPGALTVLVGTVYNSSMAWGVHSIYAVFGAEDGFRILRPLILNTIRPPLDLDNVTAGDVARRLLGVTVDHLIHWRLYVGLPLIAPVLVLSRTTVADSILPVLPILFFATQTHSPQDTLEFGQWPPSASLAFAVLPYLRSAYNTYYEKVWAEKEKRWLKEIQPRVREGQVEDAMNTDAEPQARDREDGNLFEVRIDGGIWEDWEDDSDEEEAAPANNPRAPLDRPHTDLDNADIPQDIADHAQQAQQNPPQQQAAAAAAAPAGERRLSFSPTAIAETVLGAIIFPTIANLSGEILKLALPRAWTTPPSIPSSKARIAARGLLQEKWGRSLVGGCIFVALKDCVMLYVRWKMVQMHRKRKVVDYVGKTKGGIPAS